MEPDKSRRIQIVLATLLMGATIYVLGNNLFAERKTAVILPARELETPVLLKEAGMFEESPWQENAAEKQALPPSRRDLAQFYSRRAYPGAPPTIPHALLDKRSMGGKGCLGCHHKGGYVPAFNAYAPMTPHPGWSNCLSCHVSVTDKAFFRGNSFVPMSHPKIHQAWLPGAPPPVPHSLEYRSNCQACHAGPGAIKEIRTTHPERQNCRQCHVSRDVSQAFIRSTDGGGK